MGRLAQAVCALPAVMRVILFSDHADATRSCGKMCLSPVSAYKNVRLILA